jgi:hypothetical protein
MAPRRSIANLSVPPAAHRSEEQRAFIEEARTRLGAALFVEQYERPPHQDACTIALPPYCDPPLRAGIAIEYPADCTGGFPRVAAATTSCTSSPPDTALATARTPGGLGTPTAPGTTSGRSTTASPAGGQPTAAGKATATTRFSGSSTLPDGSKDAAGCSSAPPTPNDGEDGTSRDTAYEINDVRRVSDGWRVCTSGRHGTSCGRVFDLGYGYTDGAGYSFDFLARAGYCREGGDSGRPSMRSTMPTGSIMEVMGLYGLLPESIVNAQDGMNVDIILAP